MENFFFYQADHKIPVFKEVKVGDVVIFGEKKKQYPDYLIDLYRKSPTHNAILNGLVRFIGGGGWNVDTLRQDVTYKAKAQQVIKSVNKYESLDEVSNKILLDYNIFGGFYIQIIREKGTDNVSEIYHLDFAKIRAYEYGKVDGKPVYKYAYLNNWNGIDKIDKAKEFPEYKEWDEFTGDPSQKDALLVYKQHRPVKNGELDVYPLPSYVGSIPYIEVESEIANFDINNVKNQFWGGQIISMSNVFKSQEEKDEFVEEFKRRKQGTDNAGEVMFVFTNSNEQQVVATPLQPSEIDKNIDALLERTRQKIFTANGITSSTLFGISTPGALGQRNEMMDAYELLYNLTIKPAQNIIESVINWIYSFNGFDSGAFNLKALKPITIQFSEAMIEKYISQDQMRELIGEQLGIDLSNDVVQFSSQYGVENYFSMTGSYGYQEITSYDALNGGEVPKLDGEFIGQYFSEVLGVEIDALKAKVLSAIASNEKISSIEMASLFNEKVATIDNILNELSNAGILNGQEGLLTISKKGGELLNDNNLLLDISVRYKYAGPQDSKNRDFCAHLVGLSRAGKTWSRSEIDMMPKSPEAPGNVWTYRGGFYTRKGTNDTTPYCRHHWEAVIVKTKK